MDSQNNETKSFWTLTRIALIGSAILLIAALASALFQTDDLPAPTDGTTTQPAANNTPAVALTNTRPGNPAPANAGNPRVLPANLMEANVALINGKKKKLSDYSGKILIVDLWATWCGPCRQEIPHLVEIARDYKSKGVEVIGLTTEDPEQDAELVKEFSKQFKINYPVGWADIQMQIGLMNGRSGIPQTLIIGRDGKIRNHFVGFSAPISVPQMKAALDAAVAAG